MHPLFTPRPLATFFSLLMGFSQTVGAQSWVDITANLPAALKVGDGQSLASSGSDLFVLSSPNGVLRSRDNGATWEAVNTVTGNSNNLSTFGSRSLDAIGTTIWAGGEPSSLALTGGVLPLHRQNVPADAWTPSFAGATVPPVVDAVAFDSSTNTHWAAASLGGIFKSTDDGSTWTAANGNLPGTSCRSLVARNGKVVAAIGGNGMGAFTSTDGGVTWTNNGVPLPSIGFLTSIGDNVCVIGEGSTTLTSGVYFSRDFGLTWLFSQVDTAGGLKYLKNTCSDASTMFSGGTELAFLAVPPYSTYTPKVAFSLNGGMTWDDIQATGLPLGVGKDVVRLTRHGNFLFAVTGENKLYRLDLNTVTLTPTLKVAVGPKIDKRITGGTLNMRVYAGGPGTLIYQWKKDNVDVSGQTTDILSISNAQPSDTGNYTCVVTSGPNSVTSPAARGTVVNKTEGRYDPTYDRTNMSGGETGTPFLQSDGSLIALTAGGVYKLGPNGGKTDSRGVSGPTGYYARWIDSSGRILLGGTQGSVSTHRVRRLLGTTGFPDDTSFPQLSANNTIRRIVEVPGSGYLVSGDFTTIGPVGGTQSTVTGVSMVNYDGTINTTFNSNLAAANAVGTPYVAPDNTIWMLGLGFKKVTNTGEAAAGFTNYSPVISSDYISFAYVLNSGKLLVTLANSGSRSLRLFNTNGTLDSTFNTANLVLNNAVTAAAEQADGKIILAGSFTTFGSNACSGRTMRIDSGGVFDGTFYNATGFSTAGCSGLVYDPRGYVFMANASNNATTGTFQDSSTIGDTIGQNFVRVFATPEPVSNPLETFLTNAGVPANLRGPNDDPDGDGLDNLVEYALDLNPNGNGGAFTGSPPLLSITPTLLQLTYRRVRNDVTYIVETSPSMAPGTWTTVGVTQGIPTGNGTTTASTPITPDSRFLRLSVSR